jgi:hypothetical protein
MTAEQSKDLVNRMIEEIQNKKNIDLCDELFSDAFVNHTPPKGIAADRNGMRQLFGPARPSPVPIPGFLPALARPERS